MELQHVNAKLLLKDPDGLDLGRFRGHGMTPVHTRSVLALFIRQPTLPQIDLD